MAQTAMPRSYTSITVHVVFSTHDRRPLLTSGSDVHAYIGGIINNLGARPIAIGGTADHVHILTRVPTVIAIAALVDKIKSNSSKHLGKRFAWQRGYGAFSVSPSAVPSVVRYIQNQKAHHAKFDFRDEFVRLLQDAGVEYDARYLFL